MLHEPYIIFHLVRLFFTALLSRVARGAAILVVGVSWVTLVAVARVASLRTVAYALVGRASGGRARGGYAVTRTIDSRGSPV
ncbi:MAG TPA: hypothetical protein VJZ49_03475, partial [Syntrophales bacterium]|nr:hypothetical protein [Syntrophales bacterium]